MSAYRKRPLEVEAEQFTGKPIPGVHFTEVGGYYVETIQGRKQMICPGEWIILESDGIHAYPCDPIEFERTYEPCPALNDDAPARTGGTTGAEVVDHDFTATGSDETQFSPPK